MDLYLFDQMDLSHQIETVRRIVKTNTVHRRDAQGNTILHHLLLHRSVHEDVLKLLIDEGAEVNTKNNIGQSTLICALRHKNCKLSIVRLLVEAGANVHFPDSGGFALFYAVGNKFCPPDVIEFLVNKCDILIVSNAGHTVLHHALLYECPFKNIKLLIDKKVDIHAVNNKGETALHLAAFTNRTDVVRLLLTKPEIQLDLMDKLHYTPLLRAVCTAESEPGVVRLLLKAGADILKKTISGRQVLHFAAYYGNPAIIKLLLEYHANINVLDSSHRYPLDLAYVNGNWVALKLLLGAGARVFNGPPWRKLYPTPCIPLDHFMHSSPLHRAVEAYSNARNEENLQRVRLLLKYALLERPCLHFIDGQIYCRYCEETFNQLNDLNTYLHELQLICIEPDTTLAQFILRMRLREGNDSQTDQILDVLSTNAFPIYKEVIASLLTSQDLKDGLQQHLVYMDSNDPDPFKRVRLNFDPLCSIMSYLSNEDLLNLLLACYNKGKNIPLPVIA